jgi:anti-anti-sigma regulatory factor
MLRVEMYDSAGTLTLKFAGRLVSNDAENIYLLVKRCPEITLFVDMTELTFIDSVGEDVLLFLGRLGAEFIADTSYALDICERLRLRLAAARGADR